VARTLTAVDRAQLEFPCLSCGADIGVWCSTMTTGRRASYLHADRFEAATRAGKLPLPLWR